MARSLSPHNIAGGWISMQFLYKAGAAFGSIRNCVELLHTSSSGLIQAGEEYAFDQALSQVCTACHHVQLAVQLHLPHAELQLFFLHMQSHLFAELMRHY